MKYNIYASCIYWCLSICALVLISFSSVEAQGCTTQAQCYVGCCPSGNPVCQQSCRNTCSSFPVSCSSSNPNGVPYAIWRPTQGYWYDNLSDGTKTITAYGLNGDAPFRSNYFNPLYPNPNNLILNESVWRASTGNWYSCYFRLGNSGLPGDKNCSSSSNGPIQFGLTGDYPLKGDVDGDGFDDLIVWRPNTGTWYYVDSSSRISKSVQWGLPGDFPLTSDVDGDEVADLVVWRNSTGMWYALLSSNNYSKDSNKILVRQWGLPGDHPLHGDYDGDGKDDIAVWRPANGNWYVCGSVNNFDCTRSTVEQFGLPGDKPIERDFDNDNIEDLAVWRPSNGRWYHRNSFDGQIKEIQWGLRTDLPENMGIRDLTDYLY